MHDRHVLESNSDEMGLRHQELHFMRMGDVGPFDDREVKCDLQESFLGKDLGPRAHGREIVCEFTRNIAFHDKCMHLFRCGSDDIKPGDGVVRISFYHAKDLSLHSITLSFYERI